jgi:hypothetical protein
VLPWLVGFAGVVDVEACCILCGSHLLARFLVCTVLCDALCHS